MGAGHMTVLQFRGPITYCVLQWCHPMPTGTQRRTGCSTRMITLYGDQVIKLDSGPRRGISERFQLYHLCVECFCFTQHGLSLTVIFSQPVTCRPEKDLYFDTDFQRVSRVFQVSAHDMTKVNIFSGIIKVKVTFFDFTINRTFFEKVL